MTIYCEATSPLSPEGCFGPPNHVGQHWGWSSTETAAERVRWTNDTPGTPVFTQAEVGILLTALVPVETYFPDLRKKLELMQANS